MSTQDLTIMNAVFQQGDLVLRQLQTTTNKNHRIGLAMSCGLSLEDASTQYISLEASIIQNAMSSIGKMMTGIINAFRSNYSIIYSNGEKAKKLLAILEDTKELPNTPLEDVEHISSVFNGAKTYHDVAKVYQEHLYSMSIIDDELLQVAKSLIGINWPDEKSKNYDEEGWSEFLLTLGKITNKIRSLYVVLRFFDHSKTHTYIREGLINNTKIIVPVSDEMHHSSEVSSRKLRKLKIESNPSVGNSEMKRPTKSECIDVLKKIIKTSADMKKREQTVISNLNKAIDQSFDYAAFLPRSGDRHIWMGIHEYLSTLDDLFRGVMRALPSLNAQATTTMVEYLSKSIKT